MSDTTLAAVQNAPDPLCPGCAYNLRGISSERCPECGLSIVDLARTVIPWDHRERIGRLRAFWRTLMLATFRPDSLNDVAGELNRRDAERFRWAVILAAVLPALLLLAFRWCADGAWSMSVFRAWDDDLSSHRGWEVLMLWSGGATLAPVFPAGLLITFILATGLPRRLFRDPRLGAERNTRAAALSAYACASIVWWPVPFVLACIAMGLDPGLAPLVIRVCFALAKLLCWVTTLGLPLLLIRSTLRLLSSTTECNSARLWAAAITIPLFWAASVLIGVGLFPCLVGLIWIAIDSLR